MPLVVQKYGGSSLSDAAALIRVATRIVETKRAGNDVVVAVSAMGDTTDDLIDLANAVTSDAAPREMDILLTAGERISMALLAMAIRELGVGAQAFTRSEEHTSELQSRPHLVCRLLLEKKKISSDSV